MIQNGDIHIVYFIGNGEAKKQNLRNGHPEKNKQRPPIPKDVVKFLFYKTYKSFHFPL
jgi:hypothetical protein